MTEIPEAPEPSRIAKQPEVKGVPGNASLPLGRGPSNPRGLMPEVTHEMQRVADMGSGDRQKEAAQDALRSLEPQIERAAQSAQEHPEELGKADKLLRARQQIRKLARGDS